MKSDTEPAIIAFRNRVAEKCKTEAMTEDAVKRDKQTRSLIENAIMPCARHHENDEMPRRERHARHHEGRFARVEHAGNILSRCQTGA